MCHPVWAERLSQGRESEVAASPADQEASLDPGVKGTGFAGRWPGPDCLPLPPTQESLGGGVMLCAGTDPWLEPASPGPRWVAACWSLASKLSAALRGLSAALPGPSFCQGHCSLNTHTARPFASFQSVHTASGCPQRLLGQPELRGGGGD